MFFSPLALEHDFIDFDLIISNPKISQELSAGLTTRLFLETEFSVKYLSFFFVSISLDHVLNCDATLIGTSNIVLRTTSIKTFSGLTAYQSHLKQQNTTHLNYSSKNNRYISSASWHSTLKNESRSTGESSSNFQIELHSV